MNTSENKKDIVLAAQRCSIGEMMCECDSDMFQLLRAGDDGGDPKVIHLLGKCYHFGWSTAKDLKAAVECYVRIAELGSTEALGRLCCLRDDRSVYTSLKDVFRTFCKKADEADARAEFNAGFFHYWGIGTSKNLTKAGNLFLKAAGHGCADAMYMLEICRMEGFGDGYNGMQGIELLKYSAEMGSVEAQYQLGYAYFYGHTTYGPGVEKDHKQAIEELQKAADQNHIEATHFLAWCYYYGEGVQRDVKKAFQLFKKAALMGYGYAQYHISNFYRHEMSELSENDYLVGIDFFEAAYWNRKAVDQDLYDAKKSMPDILKSTGLTQHEINKLMKQTSSFKFSKILYSFTREYETCRKARKDEKKVFQMYRLSARLGNTEGQVAVAICYSQRIGIDVNLSQAAYWYEKAAKEGNTEAAESLLKIIQREAANIVLNEGSPFAALAECYESGNGVERNEDTALLMREYAVADGDIQQARIIIEAYISEKGSEYRLNDVVLMVVRTPGLPHQLYQQFVDKFRDSIGELDEFWIFQNAAAAVRAEIMGINTIFE